MIQGRLQLHPQVRGRKAVSFDEATFLTQVPHGSRTARCTLAGPHELQPRRDRRAPRLELLRAFRADLLDGLHEHFEEAIVVVLGERETSMGSCQLGELIASACRIEIDEQLDRSTYSTAVKSQSRIGTEVFAVKRTGVLTSACGMSLTIE